MKRTRWLLWSGAFGLAFVVLQVASAVAFFTGGAPPSIADSAKFTDYVGNNQTADLTAAWLTERHDLSILSVVHDVFVNGFISAMRPTMAVAVAALLLGAPSCVLVNGRRRQAERAAPAEERVAASA